MEEIRIGICGLGGRGLKWLRLLDRIDGYRVTAICDRIEALHERALSVLAEPGQVRTYSRYEDLLADDDVDAIGLTVRCARQGAMAAEALEAGKHISSEVPAAHTIEDCWRIVLAAERGDRVYHLAEQTRFWGFVDAWADLVRSGRLGRVTYCEGQYLGYYVMGQYFQDPKSGRFFSIPELASHPEAEPTYLHTMPSIHYLPHELSPMLKVLDDRVVEVTAMGTASPSYAHPEIHQPDIQVALMKTEKDAVLRMLTGFTQPVPQRDHHWWQIIATRGCVEWRRSDRDMPKMWLADEQMHGAAEVDWRPQRTDAPPEARGSGHGDSDYYTHAAFRDALLDGKDTGFDVYHAIETAAPAILAADSIDQGSQPLRVPDFRPGPDRPAGQAPKEA